MFEKSFTCTDYRRVMRIKNDAGLKKKWGGAEEKPSN
jgi:hypothetical protein